MRDGLINNYADFAKHACHEKSKNVQPPLVDRRVREINM